MVAALCGTGLVSCFTGVENTPKITEKDVSRTINELERRQPTLTISQFRDSLPLWQVGKRFYVTDNQARLLFAHIPGVDMDSVRLAGKCLTYKGYETAVGLDNRQVVDILLADDRHTYTYHTGKTLDEFSSSFAIPLLIDMDMVTSAARQLDGKDVYIKTPIWYEVGTEHMVHGRHFIKVHIDSVLPGNKVLPLRVLFTASDNGQKAFVWMSGGSASISNRDYDSLFGAKDMHDNYPEISDEHWALIVHGDVCEAMTKDECRLAKGAPKQVARQHNQAEVREYWYYDGGSYLQFVDGLLKDFRK